MEKTQERVMTDDEKARAKRHVKNASTEQLERFMCAKRWWDVSSKSVAWTRQVVEVELTERYMGAM